MSNPDTGEPAAVDRLLDVVSRLRGEGGCPWDREQTLGTLKRYLIDTARGMNVNSFRTHTAPPPHRAADVFERGLERRGVAMHIGEDRSFHDVN